ncbi:MAG: radical SAM protein [Nanoarchaeota archaeon]|nr:radical SAM protein [Nanoarchaeota archaeon]
MKILFVRPHPLGNVNTRLADSVNRAQGVYPPLGISYNAAVLESLGHEVKILDCHAENLTIKETGQRIKKYSPDIVGISVMTPLVQTGYRVAEQAKQHGAITVIGGPQMFVYPKETVQHDSVDYGIAWEGEISFPQFIEFLKGKRDKKNVEGLVYKKENKIYQVPGKNLSVLDEIPFPARHLLPNSKYCSILAKKPFTTTMTSRGCPFHCDYCFKPPTESRVRFRSAKNVVDEMEHCVNEYGTKSIWFYDDTFTINRRHVIRVCKEILKRRVKIAWQTPTRVDVVDQKMLNLMRKAGCKTLRFGIESGDKKTLGLMNKGTSLKQIRKAVQMANRAGIQAFGFFMLGYLNETEESIRKTISLSKELDLDWAMFSNVVPFPGTRLYDRCLKQGVLNDYWRDFTLEKTSERMPDVYPGAKKWVEKAFKEFYFRPKYIKKKILGIKDMDNLKQYLGGLKAILNFG